MVNAKSIAIKNLCKSISEECGQAVKYSYKLDSVEGDKERLGHAREYEKARLHNIEHIQELVVLLTQEVAGKTTTERE